MDKYINLIRKKFFFPLIFILLFKNLECSDKLYNAFQDYSKNKTLDRLRQIYWDVINQLKKNSSDYTLGNNDTNKNLHLLDRKQILENFRLYFNQTSAIYDDNIYNFIKSINENELFHLNKTEYLFSKNMSRHFLINFAINIDKYERVIKNKYDGINDYINYLSDEEIIKYLNDKFLEYEHDFYKNNHKYSLFNEMVLNDIDIENYNMDIESYYFNKSMIELKDSFYGIKDYYYNFANMSSDEYNFYNNEDELITSTGGLKQLINLYNINLKNDLRTVDDYMYKLDFRNFQYINNSDFVDLEEDELEENVLILEKYHKHQINQIKSLRGLKEYVAKMPIENKQKNLLWGINLYPELLIDGIFTDISSNEINLQYEEVRDFIVKKDRNQIVKFAYNIHTFQNGISSIYDEKVYNFYRYKREQLYEIILSDTNSNRDLKIKSNFEMRANLGHDNFSEFLDNLPRNQLKKFANSIISLYYRDKSYIDEYKRMPSELISKKEIETFTKRGLFEKSINYLKLCFSETPLTSNYIFDINNYLNESNYSGYYSNIIDFLRSTDIKYLKLWLKKFEDYFRINFSLKGVKGGMKYSYFNDYKKEDILEIFDIYSTKFKQYFDPKEFIKIVGLENDYTPHKFLVELFYSNENKTEEILNILYSLNAYFQRKNLQSSFDFDRFIDLLSINYKNKSENYESFLFQFFRIINIFPELNNKKIFDIICLNNNTRVIYLGGLNGISLFFNRNKNYEAAINIQYYYNKTNQKKSNESAYLMDNDTLKKYVGEFLNDPSLDFELKSKVIDGYMEYAVYDYFEFYLNKTDESHTEKIFNNVKETCRNKNYPCGNFTDEETFEEQKIAIINKTINVREFQDPLYFDKNFDFLDKNETSALPFLVNCSIKDLKYYTILTVILNLEKNKENEDALENYISNEFNLNIFTKSRNEMIRYILKEKEILNEATKNENKKIEDMLPLLVKYYMLDLGSDNIYDLSLY